MLKLNESLFYKKINKFLNSKMIEEFLNRVESFEGVVLLWYN